MREGSAKGALARGVRVEPSRVSSGPCQLVICCRSVEAAGASVRLWGREAEKAGAGAPADPRLVRARSTPTHQDKPPRAGGQGDAGGGIGDLLSGLGIGARGGVATLWPSGGVTGGGGVGGRYSGV